MVNVKVVASDLILDSAKFLGQKSRKLLGEL